MLDAGLYSLLVAPTTDGTIAFTDTSADLSVPSYEAKQGAEGDGSVVITEPLSGSVLATARSLNKKLRVVQLDNPPASVEVKATGLLSWEQTFVWEDAQYEWRRDTVFGAAHDQRGFTLSIVRKPDPDWTLAVYRPFISASKPSNLQILDYQLKRLDIEDAKGLETLIIASLASFLDLALVTPGGRPSKQPSLPPKEPVASTSTAPPLPSPAGRKSRTPEPTEETEPNDFVITDSISEDLYVQGCLGVLEDRSLTYITIRARTAALVPNAVRIAAEVKTRRLKASGEELFQYVKEDKASSHVPRISLGKPAAAPYTPPAALQSVKVYLSRMPLDELAPKPPARLSPSPQGSVPSGKLQKPQKPPGASSRTSWFSGVRPRSPND